MFDLMTDSLLAYSCLKSAVAGSTDPPELAPPPTAILFYLRLDMFRSYFKMFLRALFPIQWMLGGLCLSRASVLKSVLAAGGWPSGNNLVMACSSCLTGAAPSNPDPLAL